MKDEAHRRVREAARDARSSDGDGESDSLFFDYEEVEGPIDRETLDEQYSTQMGEMYEPRRRDAS